MAFRKNLKNEYRITKAFRDLFLQEGRLKPEAEIVLAYLRGECNARGEMENYGAPLFFDANRRFDSGAAAFLLGRRRVFDLIVKHLAMNEIQIFNLLSVRQQQMDEFQITEENTNI